MAEVHVSDKRNVSIVHNKVPDSDTSDGGSKEDFAAIRERILQEQELLKTEPPTLPILTLFRRKKTDEEALNKIATQPSVYDDEDLAKYFAPILQYENLHRLDPTARWTWAEELPVINKIDWRVTVWASVAFFALDLNRGNLSQANTDNFLEDLGLDRNDFNLGNTVFRIAFLCAELPSQLISKKLGPDRWMPTIMCMWAFVAASQFFLSGKTSFLVCRALLRALQGGFIPDIILYLSYFFKGTELPFRLALFWTTLRVVDVVAPILAFGILRMRGLHEREGWRWLFLIEGCITLFIGIWSRFAMAPSPTQTKAWYRPKGWFTEREEVIMTNRILRDDPSKGDMHNRQAIDWKALWNSLKDFDLWPIYIIGLMFQLPTGPPDQYLTLTLRDLGFSTFDANILTIPSQVAGAFTMLFFTYFSEIWNERSGIGALAQLRALPCVIALAVLPASTSAWPKYALVTILLSYPSVHAIQVGWCSRNSSTVRTRTVSAAVYNMFVQFGGIVISNVYRSDDQPLYRRGNRQSVAFAVTNIVIYGLTKGYHVWRHRVRAKEWEGMGQEERVRYLETTKDTGSKRKNFQFAH
ncbi:Putative major facilitator superfamily, MFS transporter superfamily [Septoria linicola]|uniref:Major facilitator superfamily, MFS transporter superfamily n=1 Tax=Septoria linicola TaxID=215465 RepID=A0A9Q9B5H5_9PEZI|nr:Putative major facilitator superfamily, MFS transporter superfamily [Septoria linicola]